jgi:hypothetical protein
LRLEDEDNAAHQLAAHLSAERSVQYTVIPKDVEDSDYVDRYVSEPGGGRLPLQITNLDAELIGGLGRSGATAIARDGPALVREIDAAIRDKADVDPNEKAKTYLVLWIPAAIGSQLADHIRGQVFDHGGFRAVFVCAFRDCVVELK